MLRWVENLLDVLIWPAWVIGALGALALVALVAAEVTKYAALYR